MPSKRAEAAKTAASPRKRASEPIEDVNEAEVEASSTVKRRKGLGVRVIGCRIYDSENGKTCHQCRQKTMDLMASCENASGSRPCSQHFCSKCLLNRYGEKVTEVSQISLWSCPRCRGICNCSICLKKQGRVPTGILVHAAKATGCTSVAELLKKCSAGGVDQVKVPLSPLNDDFNKDENVIQDAQLNGEKATSLKSKKKKHSATYDGDQVPSDSNIEPKKDVISVTALKTVTGRKLGTLKAKNGKLIVSVDGNVEGPVANALLRMSPKRPKKLPTDVSAEAISFSKVQKHKSEPQKGKSNFNPNGCVSALKNVEKTLLTNEDTVEDSQIQKDSASEDFIRYPNKEGNLSLSVKSKKEKSKAQDKNTNKHSTTKDLKSVTKEKIKGIIKEDAEGECPLSENKTPAKKQTKRKEKQSKEEKIKVGISTNSRAHGKEQKRKGQGRKIRSKTEEDVVLPQGEALLTVAGMDLPAEAVGPAIQFIEFCLAFQPVLGLRRGDAEAVLRELTKGRLARKGCNSMLIQLQTKLLKIIESSYSDESVEVTESSSGSKSWLNILKKHLNERSPMFSSLDGDEKMAIEHKYFMGSTVVLEEDLRAIKNAINEGADSYENLSLYHKLQLLVILSDDSLETQSMRDHMESVNREYNEALKGNREEVQAARKEMRDARQKIKDAEVAKLIALGGVNGPLSHKEQEAILKRVQVETEIAITAASLEKEALSRIKKGRNDAIRAEAITWAPDGRVFYRLKGVANMGCVIVQECKVGQGGLDSWKVYSDAEEADLTKHLVQRAKMACKKRRCETNKKKCTTEIVEDEKENIVPNSVKKE